MSHWLITTDIADPRRLRRAARICCQHGERIQESVYLMDLAPEKLYALQAALARVLNNAADTVRYYPLCAHDMHRTAGLGLCRGLQAAPAHWLV